MSMQFKEISRVKVSDTTTIVVSSMSSNGTEQGFAISKYLETDRYTGFAKGGISIPSEALPEFLKVFGKENLEYALGELQQ